MLAATWWHLSFGDLLVGAGTLLLAAFTCVLALKTSKSVTAATESVKFEQRSVEALEASTAAAQRPVLVPHQAVGELSFPGGTIPVQGGPHVVNGLMAFVAVRNIGAGPALDVRGRLEGPNGRGEVKSPVGGIAVGALSVVTFEKYEGLGLTFNGNDDHVLVEIQYDDVFGNVYRTDGRFNIGLNAWRASVATQRVGVKAPPA
jgi:uncharacterized membrane-anchored protein